eukprot:PITA_04996
MEHLLQKVSIAKVMSFLDGFLGYNQVAVHPDDQEKISFTTPWGTFMYSKMPFGLMNAGAAFQRAMDIAFVGEKDKFVLIYLDDMTISSSSHQDHLQHLKKVFLKCRRFGISVNPKKSQFALEEGKLLGHIVSAADVKIDPERVKAIQTLFVPRSKKDIQSFLGKINFVRRFIPNFAELAYALIKSLKAFRIYILHSKVISYVPSASVKDVLMQLDVDGRRAKWISKLIKFNIELKPTKLVRGQGLAKMMAEENCRMLDMNWISKNAGDRQTEEAIVGHDHSLIENLASCEWYDKIAQNLLKLEVPLGLSSSQARTIKLRVAKLCIHENLLYWRDPSRILLRCLDKEQSVEVMHQFHSSICGGHHYWKTTTHKILRAGYYWPALFYDVFSFARSCDKCQSGQHRWILIAIDYFTKWIEAIPTRKVDHQAIIKFLIENIFTRFGCPHKLVTDNAATIMAKELVDMCDSMGIKLVHSTSYYLQGNGLAESSNKSLIRIIKKLLEDNKRNWDSKLKFAL